AVNTGLTHLLPPQEAACGPLRQLLLHSLCYRLCRPALARAAQLPSCCPLRPPELGDRPAVALLWATFPALKLPLPLMPPSGIDHLRIIVIVEAPEKVIDRTGQGVHLVYYQVSRLGTLLDVDFAAGSSSHRRVSPSVSRQRVVKRRYKQLRRALHKDLCAHRGSIGTLPAVGAAAPTSNPAADPTCGSGLSEVTLNTSPPEGRPASGSGGLDWLILATGRCCSNGSLRYRPTWWPAVLQGPGVLGVLE
uniref:PX domain-containing protein n=1 Tax=Macrostomum lignano TaxID=282301 RepID=A0A1I8I9A2_9PLAT